MATKVKGIYKYISNIFVVKDRELEIGGPTDVKHVAHIGWEGPSGGAPTWMKSFKAGPEFSVTSIGNSGSAITPWSSQGCGETTRQLTTTNMKTSDVTSPPKKHKRRKPKSTSSPKSSSPSTLRSSRATKHKAKSVESNHTPTALEVV
ncbi:CRIB domain-containing protein RIC11-like [Solanum tuberosum]|uniref:CRIB domain-containing protein n=1 Tax=Solanum tuberosum TaxID=4113 RepID=M1C858_SOLTU|nr:PREDICTED: CRIB domain-containing protein RIC11-like [Solanum tuberosum]